MQSKTKKPTQNLPSFPEYPELSSYSFIKTLGSGSFGRVYKAIHKETHHECAIKVLYNS